MCVFDPEMLSMKSDVDHSHAKVQELRALSTWSDRQLCVSPEQHGNLVGSLPPITSVQSWRDIDHSTQEPDRLDTPKHWQCTPKTRPNARYRSSVWWFTVLQCSKLNSLRILGRWMRMFTVPNLSSIPVAYTHFPDEGRPEDQSLKYSSKRDRLVDCVEEFVNIQFLMRPRIDFFGDRY